MRLIKSKKFIVVITAIVAIAIAGGAYAYYSATGTGTGSATAGSASTIQLSGDGASNLYPGGAAVPLTVSIHNPGGGSQYVGTISGSVADNGACLGAWFVVNSVDFNAEVAAGGDATADTSMSMTDENSNQNICQGKTLTINWSSN